MPDAEIETTVVGLAAADAAFAVVVAAAIGAAATLAGAVVVASDEDDPPRSFGSWNASIAARTSPPTRTKIFCLRSRAARGSGVMACSPPPWLPSRSSRCPW